MKKRISVLISLAMVISMFLSFNLTVFAAPSQGFGYDNQEGYLITNADEFAWLASNQTVRAYIMNDIDLGSYTPFEFNGQLIGNSEENMPSLTVAINSANTATGLFSGGTGTTVKNIKVKGTVSSTSTSINENNTTIASGGLGAFFGVLINGTIENSENYASITGPKVMGGIVGKSVATSGTNKYINVKNFGSVGSGSATNFTAGLIGFAHYSQAIINCANIGNVNAPSASAVGGFIGKAYISGHTLTVYNSYNSGEVKGGAGVAGLIGTIYNNATVNITNSFNFGNVNSNSSSGYAVSGIGPSWTDKATVVVNIKNCYNSGTITHNAGAANAYPIFNGSTSNNLATITASNCYYLAGSVSTTNTGAASFTSASDLNTNFNSYLASLSDVTLIENIPLSSWDLLNSDYSYPQLTSNPYILYVYQDGTAGAPYLVKDKETFLAMANNPTAYYKLTNSISLGDYEPFAFSGGLTADALTEINVAIDKPETDKVGLFSVLNNPKLIENIKVTGTISGDQYVGGIAGELKTSTAKTYIQYCTNAAQITSVGGYAGGIVGEITNENTAAGFTVRWCINEGNITSQGEGVGGIVGRSITDKDNLYNLKNTGNIIGENQVGGIAGYSTGVVAWSSNLGNIEGTSQIGGLVGNKAGTTLTQSFNAGDVYGTGDAVGGLAGYSTAAVIKSYNCGMVSSEYNAGALVGRINYTLNRIEDCYNVGKVISATPMLNNFVGMKTAEENAFASFVRSYTLKPVVSDPSTEKDLAAMKAYIAPGIFKVSTTDYPFPQIDESLGGEYVINNTDFNIYVLTISAGSNGSLSETGTVYADNKHQYTLIATPDTGYKVYNDVFVINSVDTPAVNNAISFIPNGNKTISVAFEEIPVESETVISSTISTKTVTANIPKGITAETINTGENTTLTLDPSVRYAVVMANTESFTGWDLVDYGVEIAGVKYTASPFINNYKFGVMFYGSAVYEGATAVIKPYVIYKNTVTNEEKTFYGQESNQSL